MVNVLAVLPSFFSLVLASSYFKRHMRLHEQRDGVPEGFTNKGPAPEISPQYGQWLSKEEVVNEWLATNGLNSTVLSPFGDWIGFETTVSHANRESAIRTLAYSIPASLTAHLQLVHPTIRFSQPQMTLGQPVLRSLAKKRAPQNITSAVTPSTLCDAVMTPECVQLLYKIPRTLASQSSNKLAVSGFLQNLQIGPISEFLEIYRTDLSPDNTFTLQTIDGGTNSQSLEKAGVEADLDVQYTIGLASGVPTVFISVGDQYQDGDLEGFLDIINFLNGKSAPPQNENTISRALA
ncbi:hypothetical protein EDB84DRAFT_1455000 [Lactarius hengduanensis]|nr:hypothetical protein EDB84DRAFT_1455000 [Lactarius hengduanensis]